MYRYYPFTDREDYYSYADLQGIHKVGAGRLWWQYGKGKRTFQEARDIYQDNFVCGQCPETKRMAERLDGRIWWLNIWGHPHMPISRQHLYYLIKHHMFPLPPNLSWRA